MIKAITFDLDNTLMDFMKMKHAAVDAGIDAMIENGLCISKQEARKQIYVIYDQKGIEYQQIFHDFVKQVRGYVDKRILSAGIVAYRRARVEEAVPYEGVKPTLEALKNKGIKLAIISDAPDLQPWTRLHEMGLASYFDQVVTFDDIGERKPSPLPFQKALELLGVAAEHSMHVGDWPERDVAGAKALGMKTAYAKYGAANNKPLTIQPDYILDKIEDLLKHI